MTLADVKEWLKTFDVAEHYYCGRLDNKHEHSLGVYSRQAVTGPVMAIGGLENSSYDIRGISLLLHWNRNSAETETAARTLWDHLREISGVDTGHGYIQYLRLTVPEPIAVGTDENGVFEYVINFDLYYRR